jgi:multisubunit Na+/H+ antiporter MnhG subunit
LSSSREPTDKVVFTENAAIITFAVLAIAFIALTSPVSGHAIARAAHRRDARRR